MIRNKEKVFSTKFWVFHNKHGGAYRLFNEVKCKDKKHNGLLGLLHPLVATKKIVLFKILAWPRQHLGCVYILQFKK